MIGEWAAVAAGGALGALLRASLIHWVASGVIRGWSPGLRFAPCLATLAANISGCALLGLWVAGLVSLHARVPTDWADLFVTTGLCSGITTFSALCADLAWLRRDHGVPIMLAYLAATLVVGAGIFNLLFATMR